MCGRYALTTSAEVIARLFRLGEVSDFVVRYNIAPTQTAPVIRADRENGKRSLSMLRWGLIPFWSKDESSVGGGNKMINARSETVAEKPAFRKLLERRRCVVPADAFYEWKKPATSNVKGAGRRGGGGEGGGPGKQPFALRLKDDRVFGFAGLWDSWKGPQGAPLTEPVETYTILTTSPNAVAKQVHDRMPVMLISPEQWDVWLDGSITDAATLQMLFKPIDGDAMRAYPVSSRVNTPANVDADLLRETTVAETSAKVIAKPRAKADEPGLFD